MPGLVHHRLLDATFKVILASAITHLLILGFQSLTDGNITILNYFAIIGLSRYLPWLTTSVEGTVIGLGFTVLLFVVAFGTQRKQ